MRIKFLATGNAPDKYEFEGEKVIAHYDGEQEEFDLSVIGHGDKFRLTILEGEEEKTLHGCEPEILALPGTQIIRNAYRENGELYVILCQTVTAGEWRESDWMNWLSYSPGRVYVKGAE